MKIAKYLLFIVFLVSCNTDGGNDEVNENQIKYGWMMYFLNNQDTDTTNYTYEVEDQNNGSVKLKRTSSQGDTDIYYYKKCLQGQVYREAENDCRGTGSESDLYGAVELQYCDRVDDSCNSGGYSNGGVLNGNGNSEAYDSCDSDTTLGRTWKVAEFHDGIFDEVNASTIYSDISNKDISVWTSKSSAYDTAEISDIPLQSYISTTDKTYKNYVLCVSEG